jgi:AmmeMemoRadiSam system protein A
MLSTENDQSVSETDQQILLDVAQESIKFALATGRAMEPVMVAYSEDLCRIGASFVTLRIQEQLRGCIGSIRAVWPLVIDVSRNAYEAAFGDPRFPPLRDDEFPETSIHVSVLSPQRMLEARNLADVLAEVRPGVDGVMIRCGKRVATFLPDVWQTLPEPDEFFRQLRLKAGLDPKAWSPEIQVSTYTTQKLIRAA